MKTFFLFILLYNKLLNMENLNEDSYCYNYNLVEGEKNKIHKANCCECKSGLGKRWYKKRLNRDLWLGPFETKEQAIEKVLFLFKKKAEFHDCCQKN